MLPNLIVIGAVKRIRITMLLKRLDDRIMSNSTMSVEGTKGAEHRSLRNAEGYRVLMENNYVGNSDQRRQAGEAECGRRGVGVDKMAS